MHVKINLDGTGLAECSTGIPFLDHMLDVSTAYSVISAIMELGASHRQNMLFFYSSMIF